jgi:23S rRNA pseudouridine2605 synthase
MGASRIDRLVAERTGLGRARAAKLVRWGRVSVGGELVKDPGAKIDEEVTIVVDEQPYEAPPLMLVYHKPVGVLSTLADPWGREGLDAALPEEWRTRFHPVGRLDAETGGLLLFSADGALTQRILHPRRAVEREYVATVEGEPGPALTARLAEGVETEEGTFTARVVTIEGQDVRLVVTEGKHRMVRRMLANAGHPVTALRRERFGAFTLGELPEGETRAATAAEIEWLQALKGRAA